MSKAFPIVNNAGFEKVFYQHLGLPNCQIEKGMKIVQDERVFNVIENKIRDEETEIYGYFFIRSQFGSVPIYPRFRIDNERKVITGSLICSCELGCSKECPHSIALMLFVNS